MVKKLATKEAKDVPKHKTKNQINKDYYQRKVHEEDGVYKGKIYAFLRSLSEEDLYSRGVWKIAIDSKVIS